ncbi:MAG: hypothetical protein ACLQU9_10060 [Acidimicrobiales bacterium]
MVILAFVRIVEFPSYEAAMANSEFAETALFSQKPAVLCDGPMVFRNLDVRRVEEM